ncbi:MAG TPA: hypothetical protein VMU53_01950 [Candidatus Sulfotelmatobacter sp.]|nr:hypothetical protein [Candidatus Sulfotelmatobacter sp.]
MFGSIWVDAGALLSALHVLGPVAVRYTMRFSASCNPTKVALEELPGEVADVVRLRTAELAKLGFRCAGCYDCGTLTRETHSYVAYFCNPATNDLASVCALATAHTTASYLEFSTSFTNGRTLATNTNHVLPLTPGDPAHRIFRFSKVQSVAALYSIHRRLLAKYAIGWWPQGEPEGEEIRRYARAVEKYGPRHERIGYMRLTADGLWYGLTWKGACLMTWRRLWPMSMVRRLAQRCAMALELHSLEARGVTALKRA